MKAGKSAPKGALMAFVVLLLWPAGMQAQETHYADSLWNTANQAYAEGRWADAVDGYEMISGMGLESAALYCNSGDAYFKEGNPAKAILYYERALKLDPSYSDARFNLALLNNGIQDRIDSVPEFVLKTWFRNFSYIMDSNGWAVCFIVFLALTLAMALMFILSPSIGGRRTGFFVGLVMLLAAALSLTFSIWQKNDAMRADKAIIMRPVTSVKSSPSSEASTDLFILHEGTKVKLIDEVGSWKNIELADGRQGWIPSADLEVI
jgi:tetratricopeptide (TPR) repeat protein